MANKFWVDDGGVDNLWSNTNNWSTTSGGTGGAGQPITTDDARFDANSNGYACEVAVSEVCRDLNFTGYTGTFTMTGQIQTYGEITIVAGMTLAGSGILWLWDDIGGGNVTTNGKTIPWDLYIGGTLGGIWTFQDDFTCTGGTNKLIRFQAQDDSSESTVNGLSNTERLILAGADGWEIETASAGGTGIIRGTLKIECQFDTQLWFKHDNDSYGWGFEIKMTVAKTLTLKGFNNTVICRIANSFSLIMGDSATLAYDGASIPDDRPRFYCCDAGFIGHVDTGNQVVKYDVFMRSVVSSTAHWFDDTDGAENEITTFQDNYTSRGTGQWQLNNIGSKLFVQLCNNSTWVGAGGIDLRGTADIEFYDFNLVWNSNTVKTMDWNDGVTHTFVHQFIIRNSQEGETTIASVDGVFRTNIHIAHECQMELSKLHATRVDARSDGQGMGLIGIDSTITDCLGVYNGRHQMAQQGVDDNDVAIEHDSYSNQNLGKTPITVSGTVKIGGTPQQFARVLVMTKTTETFHEGVARDWFMLRYVLITDVNGEWTCQVPSGVEVITEAHYDSGAQKYNSLSKPYIDAT